MTRRETNSEEDAAESKPSTRRAHARVEGSPKAHHALGAAARADEPSAHACAGSRGSAAARESESAGGAAYVSPSYSSASSDHDLPFKYVNPTSTGRLLKKESAHDHPHVDALKEKASEEKVVRGHVMSAADIFKFVGLIAFFVVLCVICYLIWPLIADIFEEGGIERVMDRVQSAGPLGVVFLLVIEFLQVVVAFIPGEVVQVAAGMLYGPWLGALVVIIGCVVSSAFVFVLVHKLGAPFVQGMVPVKYLDKFRKFEASGKLNTVVFVLFLIPGLPKDVFTYLVPLTDMRMRTFLLISNTARIPGVVVSTYAAAGIVQGDYVQSAIIFAVAAAIAVLGIVGYGRIMKFLEERAGMPVDPAVKEKLDPEDYHTRTEILEIVSEEVAHSAEAARASSTPADVSRVARAGGACARDASAGFGASAAAAAAKRPSHNPRDVARTRSDDASAAAGTRTNNPREAIGARTHDVREAAHARVRDARVTARGVRARSNDPRMHARDSRPHGK